MTVLSVTMSHSLSKYLAVAAGRASVFVLRVRATVIRKVPCFLQLPFSCATFVIISSLTDPFFSYSLQSWDHAVGVICVQEAGGHVKSHCLLHQSFILFHLLTDANRGDFVTFF
jgi:3'-phosphoadenosine 5'-phosphosulfate (PAPS) 3'-phosphatase